jgi:ketosteroid isomerase-like protein
MSENEKVQTVLHQFLDLLELGDYKGVMSLFNFEKDYLNLGTAKNEYYYGREAWGEAAKFLINVEPKFTQRKDLQINNFGEFAWIISDMDLQIKFEDREILSQFRITAILIKKDNSWKFVHSHSSTPESGIEEGLVVPTLAGVQNNIQEWINTYEIAPGFSNKLKDTQFLSYLQKAQKILIDLEQE